MRGFILIFFIPAFLLGSWLGDASKVSCPPVINILSHTEAELILEISIPGVMTRTVEENGVLYTQISLPSEVGTTQEIGKPELPKVARALGIPDDGRVKLEVIDSKVASYDNILLYPFQPPTTDKLRLTDQKEFLISEEFYKKAKLYPPQITEVMGYARWREVHIANLSIVPFAYEVADRRLLIYHYLKIRVSFIGGKWQRKIVEPWFAGACKRTLLNYEHYPFDVRYIDSPSVRYLVITHTDFERALDTLVKWHRKRGIVTRVISKSSWTSAEIKDSIVAEYNRSSPPVLKWVLLVGDVDRMPPSYAFGDFPSDFWYCDFPTIDYYGEVGIGRFSCQNLTELEGMVKKTLRYMKNPPCDDWLAKSVLVAHREEYPLKYSACKRGIYHHLYPYYRFNMDTVMGQFLGNPAVASAINEGRNVVNYRGHGYYQEWSDWGTTGSWRNSDVYALTNGDKTPIVFNIACYCHKIDYAADCIGEVWLKKFPGGAVASLGASNPSYTIPNHGYDSMLYRCLGDTIAIPTPARNYKAPMWDLGWLMLFADAHIALRHGSIGRENVKMYFWLGDPALEIWTGIPLAPVVQYQPVVPLGPFNFRVTVLKQGVPYKDALVCALKGNEFYVYGWTDEQGVVNLPINAQTPGEFYVTVTGHEILPYEGTCMASPGTTPYVIYLRSIIDDAPPNGNGDGIVNPGERINMPIWVKNVGGAEAQNVIGTLRTFDPNIIITDSVKNFGNIPAGDSAFTGQDGYRFNIALTCTNGYFINFTLSCRDAQDSIWNSYLFLVVGAPVIQYHTTIVNDSIGNNNRRIDSGESAFVIVGLKNEGRGNAYNVRAVLRSGDPRFLILDSIGTYGTILVDSIVKNGLDRFKVLADRSILPETPIPCTLYITADEGYSAVRSFRIVVGELRVSDPTPDNRTPEPLYWAYEDIDTIWTQRPTFQWIEIRDIGLRLPITLDDQTIRIRLPFVFKYYGMRYTDSLSVCGNGWISPIRTTSAVLANQRLPDPTTGNPAAMICVNWDDLYPPAGNGIWYFYDTLNRRLILQWDSVHYFNPRAQWDKFQVIIYDTTYSTPPGDNVVIFQYLTANNYSSNTVGIEDQTNLIGINLVYNNSYHRTAGVLIPGRALKFTTAVPEVQPGIEEKPLSKNGKRERIFAFTPTPQSRQPKLMFMIIEDEKVSIDVYDLTGKLVRNLLAKELKAGKYEIRWDGKDGKDNFLPNGIYFYRIAVGKNSLTLKSVILR